MPKESAERLPRRALLPPNEAGRALYIDFEGRKGKPPVLLGCSRRAGSGPELRVWQAVTDPVFTPLAMADGLPVLSLAEAVERILQRAEKRDRRIVAWSEHELDVVTAFCPQLLPRFAARYVNARTLAVYWRNTLHDRQRPERNTLASYLTLIGHEVPPEAGRGMVGATLGALHSSLAKGHGIAGIPAGQIRRWGLLREHNRHDCAGMREVCLVATRELERTAQAHPSER